MHADLNQLLSLRDGEPIDADVRIHVQHCVQCLAAAERLSHSRDRLRSLAPIDLPREFWPEIETRLDAKQRPSLVPRIAAALVVIVGAAIVYVALLDDAPSAPSTAHMSVRPMEANNDVQELIAQSRDLERLLQYLPDRPQIEGVSTAVTVDSLQQRIQWLDWQLANGADGELDALQAERLWSERVDLMDSLVKVRYAESAPMLL